MNKSFKIFLAHASEDKVIVHEIYQKLSEVGFSPWLDENDLIAGQNWQVEIPKVIQQSDIFIACLSENSVKKQGFIQKELRLALNSYAERPTESIYLILLRLDDCEIPDLQIPQFGVKLREIQCLDYWKHDGFNQLIKIIEHSSPMYNFAKHKKENKDDIQFELLPKEWIVSEAKEQGAFFKQIRALYDLVQSQVNRFNSEIVITLYARSFPVSGVGKFEYDLIYYRNVYDAAPMFGPIVKDDDRKKFIESKKGN